MKKHIFKRVLEAIPMLLFISFISYILMNLAPGDPAQGFRTPQMSEEQVAVIRASLGLDKPVFIRYFYWLKSTLSGNLGYSLITHQPVAKEILSRLPATLGLMGASMVLSILISIPLGMYTALNKNKFVDNFVSTLSYIGISIPSFWFSMILITIFALKLRLLPSVGMRTIGVNSFLDVLKHGILPTVVLSFPNSAVLTRYVRSATIGELQEDYIATAMAKGLSKRGILFKHVMKNSLIPIITILGMSLPSLVSGAFITETVFGWPGMGRLGINSIFSMDYPVIMAITMMTSIMVILGNLIADLFYILVDPRIKVVGHK
ncbi:binding--dependent transport system inner membrane component family protein [Clostridium argentinense CDC 2741]|uniref:Binding--dependent transport system inner membrane component family protein n=1 Tax=Clostridium argentinense CDC 2741 TaxID=1418104 RepID=A0A0C1U281_9CLOT|nr:ABC transporter permease [Clostridium argentinense]ARC86813.1 peptide permease [Clostridium argentinense]KIE45633.1 binding--dependent transport system inner membrane component family protein [Clostridium argentinense CDC 2741]NFF38561.1 ABC transporter permease [Clostridium argentinense]NFP51681.1 ABC transporter permease [Clostridium argentinense]NFP74020.1 ABC transporter permease [Clostridium argentinense]